MLDAPLLDIDGVDAFYADSHVLHGVSIRIPGAARVAVVGRNGAGKSTLLKGIMNAGPKTAGRIAFDGKDLGSLPCFRRARLGIAFVPEDRRIFTHITAIENLRIAGQAARPGHPPVNPRAILSRFPMLVPLEHRPGGQMSGGQQQILAIARAVAAQPRLMLLDEPTEGLAPVIVEQLAADVVQTCRSLNAGLLLCEQNLWFAQQCTDYVYVIDSGRIVWEGSWDRFAENESVLQRHLAL